MNSGQEAFLMNAINRERYGWREGWAYTSTEGGWVITELQDLQLK